jgi:hypothetical protein
MPDAHGFGSSDRTKFVPLFPNSLIVSQSTWKQDSFGSSKCVRCSLALYLPGIRGQHTVALIWMHTQRNQAYQLFTSLFSMYFRVFIIGTRDTLDGEAFLYAVELFLYSVWFNFYVWLGRDEWVWLAVWLPVMNRSITLGDQPCHCVLQGNQLMPLYISLLHCLSNRTSRLIPA